MGRPRRCGHTHEMLLAEHGTEEPKVQPLSSLSDQEPGPAAGEKLPRPGACRPSCPGRGHQEEGQRAGLASRVGGRSRPGTPS